MTTTTQKIPSGYKQTEIGVIPADWDVERLDNVANIDPDNLGSNTSFDYSFKYIALEDVNVGNLKSYSEKVFHMAPSRARRKLKKGDVLFGTVRPNLRSHLYFNNDGNDWICSTGFAVMRCKEGVSNPEYVFAHLFANTINRQIDTLLTGSNYPALNSREVRGLMIQMPSYPEQTVIATTLSDADILIKKLERLIEKKKSVKQGAMQELLTGKRRLSGFSGGWVEKKISDVCGKITTGKLNANAMVDGGEYRFYTCAKDFYQIDRYVFDTEALLVSGNGANVGYIHYYKGKFNAYQRTYVLSDFSADIHFIKLFMDRNLQERIRVEVNAGNTPYITMGTLTEMQIMIPPTKDEQTAIANVLSDMDTEIEKLESQLTKYQNIKQGMMQTLLTGKIRLLTK